MSDGVATVGLCHGHSQTGIPVAGGTGRAVTSGTMVGPSAQGECREHKRALGMASLTQGPSPELGEWPGHHAAVSSACGVIICTSSRAALMQYHGCGCSHLGIPSSQSGGWKSEVTVSAGLVSPEASLPRLEVAVFSLCLPLYGSVS